jgi:hypothetical protein
MREIDAKSEKKLVSKLPKFYMETLLKKATELYQRMTKKIASIVQQSEKAEKTNICQTLYQKNFVSFSLKFRT